MSQGKNILVKIERNLKQLGMTVTRDANNNVVASGLTVSFTEASIQSPMGGVSDAAAPFLGIGTANPCTIVISADPATLAEFKVLRVCCGFANNVSIPSGVLPGSVDVIGLGQ